LIQFWRSNDERPTVEASAARKRLVEAFAHYDTAAKRIRNLPCAMGSSQDRIQTAILTRANLFLQKNMFPLQVRPSHLL
jgi:rabenosyn-5